MSRRLKSYLFWIGALGIIFGFCRHKSFPATLPWIFGWALIVVVTDRLVGGKHRRAARRKTEPLPKDPRLDTPGKVAAMLFNYQVSNLLIFLNPLLVIQVILQLAGSCWEKSFGRPVLVAEQFQQHGTYILPVAGEWRVFNGGVTQETSHSWGIPSQRFAYDLVKPGDNGRTFAGDGRRLTDYFCFDAPILAPADGVVVKVRDGIRDAPHVGTFWMDWLTRDIGGNSVLIRHAAGEYCLLAHLKRGSVCVTSGQTVKQGQEIGRCGHSGNSTEPHLHFQFQNGKSFYFNSGLPVKFSGFWRGEGESRVWVERDYICKGTMVAAVGAEAPNSKLQHPENLQ